MWDGLERATELGLQFDLSIVDEAHSFRNSDTKPAFDIIRAV